jgi:hypothetical protein
MLIPALLVAAETTTEIPAAPILALMAFGIVIAIGGHLYGARAIVATGIAILFLATAGMVIGGFAAFQNEEKDPREQPNPREPSF